MLNRILKAPCDAALKILGYRIISLKEGGLKPIENVSDARSIFYHVNTQPARARIQIERCRGNPWFRFGPDSEHPFVLAAKEGLVSKTYETGIRGVLKEFYDTVVCRSAADVVGMHDEGTLTLGLYPPYGILLPWERGDIKERTDAQAKVIRAHNKKLKQSVGVEDGWAWSGPVTERKLDIETSRLANLLRSIHRVGYKAHPGADGDPVGLVMSRSDGEWCWWALWGQHRLAVASALGMESITVRITGRVCREDFDIWPQVKNDLYSRNDALMLFDQLFSGEGFGAARKWRGFAENKKIYEPFKATELNN